MKIAVFNNGHLGVVKEDRVHDITTLANWNKEYVQQSLVQFMQSFESIRGNIEDNMDKVDIYPLSEVQLEAPVPNPGKLLAAPVNYLDHQSEMNAMFNNAPYTIEKMGLFLKAPSSITNPDETVLLPFKDRRFDHEAELAFVIGKEAKNVSASEASNYIFGYFCLLDMTLRGEEDRSWRKSFDTFTPIGPWIVTKDEVGDPHNLQMDLWVNEEKRQSVNLNQIIWNCYTCLEKASEVMTLQTGDIITTGTPAGVSQITKGDVVRMTIERIGELKVNVDFKA